MRERREDDACEECDQHEGQAEAIETNNDQRLRRVCAIVSHALSLVFSTYMDILRT